MLDLQHEKGKVGIMFGWDTSMDFSGTALVADPIPEDFYDRVRERLAALDATGKAVHQRIKTAIRGAAYGDALGAPIEFANWESINSIYGPAGLRTLVPFNGLPAGSVTDDFQMFYLTGLGLVRAYLRQMHKGIVHIPSMIHLEYLKWLWYQQYPIYRRAPGNTCIAALKEKRALGSHTTNHSKGCGGVMRVAPIGMAFRGNESFSQGCESAHLTHGHPGGILPSGFMAHLVSGLIEGNNWSDALAASRTYLAGIDTHSILIPCIDRAMNAAKSHLDPNDLVQILGSGWTGDEALSIAIYSLERYHTQPEEALRAAINHAGDSDSTGCLVGTLLGALGVMLGKQDRLEDEDKYDQLADALMYIRCGS